MTSSNGHDYVYDWGARGDIPQRNTCGLRNNNIPPNGNSTWRAVFVPKSEKKTMASVDLKHVLYYLFVAHWKCRELFPRLAYILVMLLAFVTLPGTMSDGRKPGCEN
jgi:hypothetical protein